MVSGSTNGHSLVKNAAAIFRRVALLGHSSSGRLTGICFKMTIVSLYCNDQCELDGGELSSLTLMVFEADVIKTGTS